MARGVVVRDVGGPRPRPPGSRPALTRTWKPLQMPRIRPPRLVERRGGHRPAPCPAGWRGSGRRRGRRRRRSRREWSGSETRRAPRGDSSRRPMCQVSTDRPRPLPGVAEVSSSQFVPGARRTISAGVLPWVRRGLVSQYALSAGLKTWATELANRARRGRRGCGGSGRPRRPGPRSRRRS